MEPDGVLDQRARFVLRFALRVAALEGRTHGEEPAVFITLDHDGKFVVGHLPIFMTWCLFHTIARAMVLWLGDRAFFRESCWMVFERVSGQESCLVLINTTGKGNNYNFHEAWLPRYIDAQLIFRSDGHAKKSKDETQSSKNIDRRVSVPPYGFVLLRQKRP